MTITTHTVLPDAQEDQSPHLSSPQIASATDRAAVEELCHILARIMMRVNADQQRVDGRGGAQ
jgi:hypothetical protein